MSLENERIVYNASKALNNVCYVKSTGIVDPDPSWSALREDSKDVVIFYIVDGKARLTVTGGDYPLYRGDCVIFPPRKYSKIKSDSKNPPTVYWLRCGGELVDAMIKCYFPDMRAIVATCDVQNIFTQAGDLITRASKDVPDTLALMIHKLFVTVRNSLSTSPAGKSKTGLSGNKYEEYIVTHMYDKLNVQEFASHFGMTVPVLTSIIKRKFGKTPYQYYLAVKINLAKHMLSSSQSSVEDIAARLCFTDRTHFSKLFKRETGLSPAQYRNGNN